MMQSDRPSLWRSLVCEASLCIRRKKLGLEAIGTEPLRSESREARCQSCRRAAWTQPCRVLRFHSLG